jgi:hypothetical protein
MPTKKSKQQNKIKYYFDLTNLCTPSMVYFIISLVALILLGIQNLTGNDNTLCIGSFKCNVGNKMLILLLNAIYILFWTFIFDLMCKAGYSELSWFIVFIPIILFFLFIGLIVYQSNNM